MNKRIAYILTTFPCGSETFIRNEISLLKEKGLDIVVFAAKADGRTKALPTVDVYYRPDSFTCKAVKAMLSFLFNHPGTFCRIILTTIIYLFHNSYEGLSLIKNIPALCYYSALIKKLDISHLHAGFMNLPARIAFVLSKATNTTYSIAVHARDGFVDPGAVSLKVKNTEFVICCTKTMANHIKIKVPAVHRQKIHTIYHGLPVKRIDEKSSKSSKPNTIIAIGRFVKKKGFNNLLTAFAQALQEYSELRLILVGDGPQRQILEDCVSRLGLDIDVSFTGWLDHQQTLEKLSQAALLVAPSVISDDNDQDGIANVILEAFMLKVPVVASNLDTFKEAVVDEQTGLLVPQANIPQLKNAIIRLLNDPSLRNEIVDRAWQHCNKYFNSSVNIENTLSLFNSLDA